MRIPPGIFQQLAPFHDQFIFAAFSHCLQDANLDRGPFSNLPGCRAQLRRGLERYDLARFLVLLRSRRFFSQLYVGAETACLEVDREPSLGIVSHGFFVGAHFEELFRFLQGELIRGSFFRNVGLGLLRVAVLPSLQVGSESSDTHLDIAAF